MCTGFCMCVGYGFVSCLGDICGCKVFGLDPCVYLFAFLMLLELGSFKIWRTWMVKFRRSIVLGIERCGFDHV